MTNLLYCGNDKVFDGILTSTLSVVRRLEKPRPLTVYIYTMDLTRRDPNYTPITDAQAAMLEQALRVNNPSTWVMLMDVTGIYETHLKENCNEGCYCSPYTLLRLLADLTPMPDKFLYLDADVMLCKDITLLYDMDIDAYEYAAAPDHYGKFFIHPHYINAGVLLFNMKLCRQTDLFAKARQQLRSKKLMFADQSALARAASHRKVISQRFNDQKFLYKNTVIRHFSKRLFWTPYPHTENIKQWQVEKVRRRFGYICFDDILEEYETLKETSPWNR